MRSNAPVVAPDGSASQMVCPPMYSELFETNSSLGTPPSYKSITPSSGENSSPDLLEQQTQAATDDPPKPAKVRKPKKKGIVPAANVETLPKVSEEK